jgi:tetratricopeptide (TPR) repeat protein
MVLTFRHSPQPPQSSLPPDPDPDPQDVVRLVREAALLVRGGDLAGALRCYQAALLMDEGRAELWLDYGMLQERCRQFADAVESYEFALRLNDAMYLARYRVAKLHYAQGRPLEALAHFKRVTQQRPAYLPAWRHVVQITWALGQLADAENYAREALRHARDAEIGAMLGSITQDRADAAGR